jgi:hypothetical protein
MRKPASQRCAHLLRARIDQFAVAMINRFPSSFFSHFLFLE